MTTRKQPTVLGRILHVVTVGGSSTVLTVGVFLVLPLLQAITRPPSDMYAVREIEMSAEPPPPPPIEDEPEDEPEPEEEPPEMLEEAAPLDLSQLELALNPGMMGDGWLEGDFAVKLNAIGGSGGGDMDELFSVSDLDQKPRVVYQASPALNAKLRRKAPGTVYIVFVVDERGRVTNPVVQKSTDPVFDKAALNAVKQWKFEPGKRNGQAVSFRMRVPITFPKG